MPTRGQRTILEEPAPPITYRDSLRLPSRQHDSYHIPERYHGIPPRNGHSLLPLICTEQPPRARKQGHYTRMCPNPDRERISVKFAPRSIRNFRMGIAIVQCCAMFRQQVPETPDQADNDGQHFESGCHCSDGKKYKFTHDPIHLLNRLGYIEPMFQPVTGLIMGQTEINKIRIIYVNYSFFTNYSTALIQ